MRGRDKGVGNALWIMTISEMLKNNPHPDKPAGILATFPTI